MAKNDVFYINALHKLCLEWLTALQEEDGQVAREVVADKVEPQYKEWRKEYLEISNKPDITDADREKLGILWQNMTVAQEFEDAHKGERDELLADRVYAIDKFIEHIADDFFNKQNKS